jgi:rubrerythrin
MITIYIIERMATVALNTHQRLLNSMTKQRAYAWAKYYDVTFTRHEHDVRHYRTVQLVTTDAAIPEHIKSEFLAMGAELRKTWECPVCIDMIDSQNLEITPCGHYFCKGCLSGLKTAAAAVPTDCKCPVCRRKIPTANTSG